MVIRVGSNPGRLLSLQKEGSARRNRGIGRTPGNDRGWEWSHAAPYQAMPETDGRNQKLERDKKEFFPESQREHGPGPANTMSLYFQTSGLWEDEFLWC